MNNVGRFQLGHDSRRNTTAGRAPTAASLAATTRAVLGKDYRARLLQLDLLAQSGDPSAIVASAVLLAAAMRQQRKQGEADGMETTTSMTMLTPKC